MSMTLDDVTLELMESNQKLGTISKSINESNEYLELAVDTFSDKISDLIGFFEGRTLKDAEEKREQALRDDKFLKAVEDLKPEKTEEEKKEEKDGSGLTGILAGLAITIGSIAGVIKAQVDAIKLFTTTFGKIVRVFAKAITPKFITESITKATKGFGDSIVRQFNTLKATLSTTVANIGMAIRTTLASLFTGLSMQFDLLKASIGESKVFQGIKATVSAFFKPFTIAFNTLKEITGVTAKIGQTFSGLSGTLKAFSGLVSKTLGIASKLFLPLTIVITLWDTVKGMFEGFEKEGIVGGIKGAITGLFNSLIFGPLDLIKSAISWVLGFFGFDKAEAILDSFSFEDTFTAIIDALFYPFKLVQDAVVSAGKYISDKFGSVLSFFGIDFGGEEEKLKQEIAKSQYLEEKVEQAGAVAINPETGGIVGQTEYINGVFDPEESRRALEARGLRPLNDEERVNLEANLEANRKEKEAALKEIQDSPKLADYLPSIDDITESLKGIGTSIWESMTSAFDSIVETIKEVDIAGFIGDVSGMASNFFKNILRGVLPDPNAMKVELPSVDTWFGKIGGGSINLNPIPDSLYEFAGINPTTGETISPPSAKKAEALSQEMEMATSEQNQMKDATSSTTNVVDASSSSNNITNNTTNNTIVAPAPNPVRQPNSPSDVMWAGQ